MNTVSLRKNQSHCKNLDQRNSQMTIRNWQRLMMQQRVKKTMILRMRENKISHNLKMMDLGVMMDLFKLLKRDTATGKITLNLFLSKNRKKSNNKKSNSNRKFKKKNRNNKFNKKK